MVGIKLLKLVIGLSCMVAVSGMPIVVELIPYQGQEFHLQRLN